MDGIVWILDRVALAAHQRQLAEHRGRQTAHNPVRLAMALAWPRNLLALAGRVSLFDLAAAYAEGVLRLRPFAEGNEGTAFLWSMMFLGLNERPLSAPLAEKYSALENLVNGRMDRKAFAEWMALRHLANQKAGRTIVRVRVSKKQVDSVMVLKGTSIQGITQPI